MPFDIDISSIEAIFDAEKKLYSDYFTIKVKTCYYHSNKGLHSRKDVKILKRKSDQQLIDYFFEDVSMVGVEYDNHFGQFFDLEDGEYQVFVVCHRSYYDDDCDCEYVIEKV
jgi:hypothetical protein